MSTRCPLADNSSARGACILRGSSSPGSSRIGRSPAGLKSSKTSLWPSYMNALVRGFIGREAYPRQ